MITGGASNIGREAALAYAREGASVLVVDADPLRSRDTLADLQEITDACAWVRADLGWEDQVLRARDKALETFGRIDILINNAAIGVTDAPLELVSAEQWDAGLRGNVRHMVACAKAVIPEMVRAGGGAIVNTCTIYGVVGGTSSLLYGPVKAGAIQLTRHIALYYGRQGIRANCVCPGHIVTPRTRAIYEADWSLPSKYPIGRLGRMDDIVEAYLYLTGPESAFVTGAVFLVDGGYTIG
jgi:NAD(P)-dependent dehydrogenase (short-subunit alcohol dehydrogenase family)